MASAGWRTGWARSSGCTWCPTARSRGVGRALLTALEDAGRELGFERVRLDAGPAQTHSKSLFERTGYVRIPPYNANHIADYFAEKDLRDRDL